MNSQSVVIRCINSYSSFCSLRMLQVRWLTYAYLQLDAQNAAKLQRGESETKANFDAQLRLQ